MITRLPKPVILSLAVTVIFSLILGFSWQGLAVAQDETSESTVTPVPTDPPPPTDPPVPTEEPTEPPIPTEVPTEPPIPTEVPTEPPIVTEEPTEPPIVTEEPTEPPIATEIPTEPPVATETPTATLVAGAPEIIAPDPALLQVTGEQPLAFEMRVKDDAGPVTIAVDTTLTSGAVTWTTTSPVETEPPFYTVLSVNYLPAAGFSGVDRFVLTASNLVGNSATTVIEITVNNLTPTVEPTEAAPTTQRLLISYRVGASEESLSAMLSAIQGVEIDRVPQIGVMLVAVPDSMATPEIARATIQSSSDSRVADAGIAAVEADFSYQINYVPNDVYFGSQWALADMYVPSAWDMSSKRGSGVTVAVIDTGVDLQHPELASQTVAGWDFYNDDKTPDDDNGHGTHVSGIIAAKTNNSQGIAGVAYNAKIMPLKACSAYGSCPALYTMAAIVHAVDNNAKVINMSLQQCNGPNYSEQAAVQYALSRGVVVVAAAGNGVYAGGACAANPASYSYPASYPGVVSVAAHDVNWDSAGTPAGSGYNYNDRITVSAPGISILSTVPLEYGAYATWDGTSMASPQVAGIAALLISANVATTPATVREALICGAIDPDGNGYDNFYGWGIVQADWAMNWHNNSASCQISQPNDDIEQATKVTKVPYSVAQPVSSRSVTSQPSDPWSYPQTLWYQFTPPSAGYYQISTLGSSYDTVLGVFQGNIGALTALAYSEDAYPGNGDSQLVVGLNAKQPYYVVVAGYDPVADQVIELRINQAVITNYTKLEENSTSLAYSGTWALTSQSGASGGKVQQTSDDSATVSFGFRGVNFVLGRTVGPDQGSMDVYIDGGYVGTIDNRAAMRAANQKVTIWAGDMTGGWHRVILRRSAGGPAGPVTIDTLVTQDYVMANAISGMVDDRDSRMLYFGGTWYDYTVYGAYKNTISLTTTAGAFVRFRGKGDTIILYRNVGPGYGSMGVYVDGRLYATMPNDSPSAYSVPFVITGLPPVEHVVEVYNNTSSRLEFDGAAALTTSPLKTNATASNRSASILYSGAWYNQTYPYNLRTTYDPIAMVDFTFDGNWFCIGYTEQPGGKSMDVYVDQNHYVGTIDTDYPLAYGVEWCSTWYGTLLADTRHRVTLVSASTGTFTLDYVYPARYGTLTPSRGLVAENDPAFMYSAYYGVWYQWNGAKSLGGYPAKGGSIRYTVSDGSSGGRVSFFINGSGFILYTGMGPSAGAWEIWVDGSYHTTLNLYDGYRWRPLGYGVTNLGPGIHYIELRAIVSGSQYADFDGVRVFP